MSSENEDDTPAGARIIWFGMYNGQPMDQMPDDYRRWAVYSDRAKEFAWHGEFAELNQQYLAERLPLLKPDDRPGNQKRTRFNGQPFNKVYNNKKWLRWFHTKGKPENPKWYWEFLDLENQYELWLKTHRREYHSRRPTQGVRDIGQKCGPWDDREDPVPPNDQYDLEDDFIDDSNASGAGDNDDYVDGVDNETNEEDGDVDATGSRGDEGIIEDEQDEEEQDEEDEAQSSSEESPTEENDEQPHGAHVIEIPTDGKIREAKDLFNDDDDVDMLERSDAASGHLSDRPDKPQARPSRSDDPARSDGGMGDSQEQASPKKRRARGDISRDEGYASGELRSSEVIASDDMQPPRDVLKTPRKRIRTRSPQTMSDAEDDDCSETDDHRDSNDPLYIPVTPMKNLGFSSVGDGSQDAGEGTDDDQSLAAIRRTRLSKQSPPRKRAAAGRRRS
ncbi:hypothetical protein NM688_g6794 [Phlebia brevispora]|uniref:Uncharacterized protein n=1 Tax=Phlebia brevispora TaxID=194682 RepID=A0ACC1SCC5_9APHY|nr:hypothetical protein NM688_g6794 [Phlebia brevispora]